MVETIEQQSAICIDAAKWGAAMMRYRLAELRFDGDWSAFVATAPDHPDRALRATLVDQSSDELAAARRGLLDMPAPDHASLRWKLDQVLVFEDDDEDYTAAWSKAYVLQTMADYKRLLPA